MKHLLFCASLPILLMAALEASVEKVPAGSRVETEGVIVQKSDSQFRIRLHAGSEYEVILTPATEIVEKKVNPFRGATTFSAEVLVPGLNVRVEGLGDTNGSLLAEKVRFTKDELKVARTISSGIVPVEQRLAQTEQELDRTQDEMHRSQSELRTRTESLQGRVEELDDAFLLARSEAHQAQSTADRALEQTIANESRFGTLDDYSEREVVTLQFGFNSAELTQESKQQLDELSERLMSKEAFLLEVVGYASSDGNPEYNRSLSERRSETVVSYLAENCDIPLRRFIQPHGFGESSPVADNSTRNGREQNRRVELRVLENLGITGATAPQKREPDIRASLKSQ